MTTKVRQGRALSRGIDYLGDLGAKLRDLQGFATLAHELIQNADDAPGAGQMSFDVCEEALIVENDGVFSDCGNIDADECPWKLDPATGHRCDFHRFRRVASGDKRDQAGTIGAFGIGFISVLQITDQPELISSGRHWILYEDRPEHERIFECAGCSDCQAKGIRTKFILPWVRDPDTVLRRALRAPALTAEDPDKLLKELERTLPTAMLFLKKLYKLLVFREGAQVLCLERLPDGESLIVSDGQKNRIWLLLRGNFKDSADALREKHPNRIEAKRAAEVTLAIPEDRLEKGVFCAYLPTQQETGLPFHLNADFFPTSDRKRIILETDYQSEWNRAAIEAAATVLQDNLDRLPKLLGHEHLWHLLRVVHRVAEEADAGHKDETLGLFWEGLRAELPRAQVFYSSRKEWKTASEVLLFEKEEEEEVAPILEGLGISLLHLDLRPYFNLLRTLGVRFVDLVHIASALQDAGLDERTDIAALPKYLSTERARQQLRRELALLLKRQRRPAEQQIAEQRLCHCAVVPGIDGKLWPCRDVFRADDEAIELFQAIDPQLPFLAELEEDAEPLRLLCPAFTPAVAVARLENTLGDEDESHSLQLDPAALLGWFEDRREEVLKSVALKGRLSALPVFPCSDGLKPLSMLSLPGDFTDPIGLAGVVDLARLKSRRDFLRELGARELTFAAYAADHVPRAFRDGKLTPDQKRRVIRLLADRIGEIQDDDDYDVFNALLDLAVVECSDGNFRQADEVYFDSDIVRVVLGEDLPFAVLPMDHESAVRALYRWLGVEGSPRFDAITKRVKKLTADLPTEQSKVAVAVIFRYLGDRLTDDDETNPALMALRSMAWLPARGDQRRWYRPGDLFAVFQDYLFESQAKFLDLPREVQNTCGDLLDFLLVKNKPSPGQVVAHLLHCVGTDTVVNKEVYRFLNDNAQDGALSLLVDKPCLLLPDNSYVKASQAFWGEHPFGRFRYRLGPDLRKYGELFARLGVREGPDHRDAFLVIQEISSEYGAGNHILDEAAFSVLLACWQRLDRALAEGAVQPDDLARLAGLKVVPDVRWILNPPEWMFFEDRAGLAAKFKRFLVNNVIARPQGAWRAMAKAGVSLLSTAVRSHLVECQNPVADDSVANRLRNRRPQLLRVLEPQNEGDSRPNLCLLDQLRCLAADEVRVQYSVSAFGREVTSEPESLPAKFQSEEGTLHFVRRSGDVPWASIARELALAISPDADPGRLAAGIKEVLAAGSEEAAGAILDELGFAPLEMAPDGAGGEAPIIDDLGGETAEQGTTEQPPTRDVETEQPSEGPPAGSGSTRSPVTAGATESGNGEHQPASETAPSPSTVLDAIESILGSDASPPTPLPAELQERLRERPELGPAGQRSGAAGGRRDGRKSGKREGQRQGARGGYPVLRSYVSPDDPDDEREVDPEVAARRQTVSRAGLKRVLQYEHSKGRVPKAMPHNHPGYDVEASNVSGEIERYIEVKSIDTDWEGPYAGLTATQFRTAQQLGTRYWLYVVERANGPDRQIYRIQDPARRVTQFMFDDGWKALAETDGPPAHELAVEEDTLHRT
jgi:hypothetical protein